MTRARGDTPPTLIALWKPHGVVSRFAPDAGQIGLGALIPLRGVYPIGRLDQDSEGLLLLGDDGPLAHRLTDPRFAHPRSYLVQVEGEPRPDALAALAAGVVIQGRRTRPAQVRLLDHEPGLPPRDVPIRVRRQLPTRWLELTLTEGRNRQVRRMTAAVGHPTLRLVRVAIGPIELSALALEPGGWRRLLPHEERALRSSSHSAAKASTPAAKADGSSSRPTTQCAQRPAKSRASRSKKKPG